ncbi:MAG TPA: serine hydrolase [Myxococcota bacterium]|nr:serine hydrolase [Myxococcota bacterium]
MSGAAPFPAQPAGVDWPTRDWPRGELPRGFREPEAPELGRTLALVAIWRGRLVLERYAPPTGPDAALVSWSVAKSVLHALVGVLVRDGKLDPHAPADLPAWRAPGDARAAITLEQLLRMRSGLAWREDYVDAQHSDVIEMLFGRGKDDVAAFAGAAPLAQAPDTGWCYSSGTSNLVAWLAGRAIGGGAEACAGFLRRELFARLGMASASARFDAAGTWIGSSFVFASARDFARFGLLYLRGGVWEGERVLSEGWVEHARRETPGSAGEYGAHWWLPPGGEGMLSANGYRGQYVFVAPARDVVVVRLGESSAEQQPLVREWLAQLVARFPRIA